jgi:prevent-host-death family protein
LDYIIDMKIANIAEFKNKLSEYLAMVDQGEEIEVRKYNIPIAKVIPVHRADKNKTKLGCGRDTVKIKVDLTEPLIPGGSWEMLNEE